MTSQDPTTRYISRRTAVEVTRSLFGGSDRLVELSLEDIFVATGRDPGNRRQNKRWLANRLTALKYYDLVAPVYARRGRKLTHVRLTHTGQQALAAPRPVPPGSVVTLDSIARRVCEFNRQNPHLKARLTAEVRQAP